MAVTGSLQLSLEFGICRNQQRHNHFHNFKSRSSLCVLRANSSSIPLQQYSSSCNFSKRIHRRVCTIPRKTHHHWRCRCFLNPSPSLDASCVKNVALTLSRSFNRLQGNPVVVKLASAVGIVAFALWGLEPLLRQSRYMFLHKNDSSWKKSSTYLVATSYVQPLLLWTGAIIICRAFDNMILPTEASQIVKQRLLNFVRSLSTVLAFAYCLSSVIQQAQKFVMETNDPTNTRNMGFQFAGKAVYTAVWVAAVSLFMELLGFSTQKWLTAGGLGTVLLTLAGREIFTNFLSSAMIHATRPFVVNEWIQTKIEGYDVSGTVEHVGWWSPTIIRGEDREAVHIPNHKFTVNVVRNLTQKTHWRIKTHLAISHLDVSKINIIVADMRKVLAKNPQVEQQKLHRRVFLDNINPENQALLILVSCFVKTSHFEEYLCVKEAILLDLLRVIRHHRARLATPIRTVQKIYSDADLDNVPFSDSIFNRGTTSNRPLLLVEPSYKINGDEKNKPQARSLRVNGEEDGKTSAAAAKSSSNAKVDDKGETASSSDSTTSTDHKSKELSIDSKADNAEVQAGDLKFSASDQKLNNSTKSGSKIVEETSVQSEDSKLSAKSSDQKLNNSTKSGSKIVEETSVQSEDSKVSAKSSDQKLNNSTKSGSKIVEETIVQSEDSKVSAKSSDQKLNNSTKYVPKIVEETSSSAETSPGLARNTSNNKKPQKLKQEETRQAVAQPSVSKASLEENIVLGVALEGSKRTLPIEEEVVNAPEDMKELAAMRSGSDKDKHDTKRPKNPPVDQSEQQLD